MNSDFDYQFEYQRISATIEDFAQSENDTTIVCLLRLLAEYHNLKAEKMYEALDREQNKQQITRIEL